MTKTDKKKSPQRMCVVCRKMYDKKDLLRIVKSPNGEVAVDLSGKSNGRGAYVCKNEACINKCRKPLSAHLKCEIPQQITEQVSAFKNER